jgi:predicted secreted hydrolase
VKRLRAAPALGALLAGSIVGAAAVSPAAVSPAAVSPAAVSPAAVSPAVSPAGDIAPAAESTYATVTSGRPLIFPADFGSHPQFRTEWWYVTGWVTTQRGEELGFQVTFFRAKPDIEAANPSSFTPRQILIAHCAISDPKRGRLWQDQRIRRAGLGLADAVVGDTHVWIDDWSMQRKQSAYRTKIAAEDFTLDLALTPTQPALLNGDAGVSRKGPAMQAASYYYSLPHVRVAGIITRHGNADRVTGEAWFDHEWSSEYLDSEAVGWDWVGINLDDGAALMAFRIRGPQGEPRWAGGTLRSSDGRVQILQPAEVDFRAGRRWQSPRTGIAYPVTWQVRAGARIFDLVPLLDDQENDTRLSTGAIYWEGAVRANERNQPAGRGYLELTGYGEKLRLR